MMSQEPTLPTSPYINIEAGLKYLNGNKKLYLKVLHSFTQRYNTFNIEQIEASKIKKEMHTLKGLSATLGLEQLSQKAKEIEENPQNFSSTNFSEILTATIKALS